MSSIKLKFDRESNLNCKYFAVAQKVMDDRYEKNRIGTVVYESNGTFKMESDGFSFVIEGVDEAEVVISPMDAIFSKVTFKVKKMDGSIKTLPMKFYGIRGTNFEIGYDNEIGGSDELPDN